MQFQENAEVKTSDGRRVGRIDRVVINPRTNELTHLVVKKGLLLKKDKVIPLDRVEIASEEGVVLKSEKGDPDQFPEFEETHYIPLESDPTGGLRGKGPAGKLAWYYPMPRGAWWRLEMGTYPGYPDPPYVRRTDRNIPEGNVPLEEGAEVLSKDDKHIGDVERVFVDDDEQRVTHLLVSKGLLSKTSRLIPSMWVNTVTEERVRLDVDEAFVDKLPQFPPEGR